MNGHPSFAEQNSNHFAKIKNKNKANIDNKEYQQI